MKHRTPLYLAVTALCLGLLLWLLEQREREDTAGREIAAVVFPELDPARIVRMRIEREDWTLDVERQNRDWRIVRPFSERADAGRIHRILMHVARLPVREQLTYEQWTGRGLLLRHFGLDKPLTTLVLSEENRDYVLWIGAQSPLDHGLYVQIAAMPHILLTDNVLSDLLPQEADALLDRTFFHGVPGEVSRLDIKPYAGHTLQLVRGADGRWLLQHPFATRTENGAVRERLELLFGAQSQHFLPDITDTLLAGYGLEEDEAAVRVTVWKSGIDTGTDLFFGNTTADGGDYVYARRGDSTSVFTLPRRVRDGFVVTANDLRDRSVFGIEPWTVTGLELKDDVRGVRLQLQNDGWHVASPVQWKADDEMAMQTVAHACDLRISRFLELPVTNAAPLGLKQPQYVLELREDAGKNGDAARGRRLLIGVPTASGDEYYAQLEDEANAFTIPSALLSGRLTGTNSAGMTFTDPLVYHDLAVLDVEPETVWRIDLQRNDMHHVIERDPDGQWTVVQPGGHRVHAEQVRTLLATVRQLRALRVEHRGIEQPEAFGFDRPGMVLTLRLTGAEGISQTVIGGGRARAGGVFTMVQGRDLVFAVDGAVIARLSGNLVEAPRD